jgi:MFS family permease
LKTEAPLARAELSYLELLRVRGFPGLITSQFLGRIAQQMVRVSLVLFVLARFQSPQLAGAATFLLLFPGLLVAPVAGALLDRHGRTRLISLDYLIASGALFSVAALSARGELTPALLLAICALASLTGPLSWAGLRSMFPSVVPTTAGLSCSRPSTSTGMAITRQPQPAVKAKKVTASPTSERLRST